jgi:hypothetical protein
MALCAEAIESASWRVKGYARVRSVPVHDLIPPLTAPLSPIATPSSRSHSVPGGTPDHGGNRWTIGV